MTLERWGRSANSGFCLLPHVQVDVHPLGWPLEAAPQVFRGDVAESSCRAPAGSWALLSRPVSTEHGFVGYSEELMFNNTLPDYSQGESFFTVFGVFFPAATGTVMFYPHPFFLHRNICEMSRSNGSSSGL